MLWQFSVSRTKTSLTLFAPTRPSTFRAYNPSILTVLTRRPSHAKQNKQYYYDLPAHNASRCASEKPLRAYRSTGLSPIPHAEKVRARPRCRQVKSPLPSLHTKKGTYNHIRISSANTARERKFPCLGFLPHLHRPFSQESPRFLRNAESRAPTPMSQPHCAPASCWFSPGLWRHSQDP